jgi:hypothetical protein
MPRRSRTSLYPRALANYRAGEIDLDAVASGAAVIVFADTWIPGSKAYVDGREASLFRVNHTQFGIYLPKAGTYRVRLAYEPSYRPLFDILAAPTRLLPNAARSEPFSRRLGLGDLPALCATTNADE